MTMQNTDAQVEVFDLRSLRSDAGGYSSAVFDGRFIYLVPLFNGEFFGEVARFVGLGVVVLRDHAADRDARARVDALEHRLQGLAAAGVMCHPDNASSP